MILLGTLFTLPPAWDMVKGVADYGFGFLWLILSMLWLFIWPILKFIIPIIILVAVLVMTFKFLKIIFPIVIRDIKNKFKKS